MFLQKMFTSGLLATTLVMSSGFIFQPQSAQACGGFFCQLSRPVDQAGERVLFIKDGENIITHVQIQYTGSAEDFSWLLPVPAKPEILLSSDTLFTNLRNATRPQFNFDLTTKGKCKDDFPLPQATTDTSTVDISTSVQVQEGEVGPFATAILQSKDVDAAKTWLKDNGYDIPPDLDPLLTPYISDEFYLVALKLKKDRGVGDLQPIAIKYKGENPMIPIRLTAVAAQPDMDVFVWVLGKDRAIPENYRHAEINEARINWLTRGSNYRNVVTEAINDSGGLGFVTDFAGSRKKAMPIDFLRTTQFNLTNLKAKTDPLEFAVELHNQSYFSPGANQNRFVAPNAQEVGFLTRYIPKPAIFAATPDDQFYNFLATGFGSLSPSISEWKDRTPVDVVAAAKELEDTVLKPMDDLVEIFDQDNNDYLTALYSTISPAEMTRDPIFKFNSQLPEVSNVREAKGERQCSEDKFPWEVPIKITLSNGKQFTIAQATPPEEEQEELFLPAAETIEQFDTQSKGDVITNNQDKISVTLNFHKQIGFGNNGQMFFVKVKQPEPSPTVSGKPEPQSSATSSEPIPTPTPAIGTTPTP